MRRCDLGHTGLAVSALTFGTSGLARADPKEARAALSLALDRGIKAIEIAADDVAAIRLTGEVLRTRADQNDIHILARVSSLVRFDLPSPQVPAGLAYPGARIRAETDALLAALGIERIALQQLHAWCPEWLGEGDWHETLAALRDEGKIAGASISLFDHDVDAGLEAVARGAIDAVQAMVNIFDSAAFARLLPLCGRSGVGVIARTPLYYGALAGIDALARDAWHDRYFYPEHRRETAARVEHLAREAIGSGESLAALALRFALSHPAVTTVAIGMSTVAHVEANLRAAEQGPLDADRVMQLARHRWLC
jgi:aryl-alcohol dehydrogenase-like predicted oxidoreductase